MSNQLNDPMPILLTDRLSTATAGAVLRVAAAGACADDCAGHAGGVAAGGDAAATVLPAPARLLDSVFGPLTLRPLSAADTAAHAAFLHALGERGRRMRRFSLPAGFAAGFAAGAAGAAPGLSGIPVKPAPHGTPGGLQLRLGLTQAADQAPAPAPAPLQGDVRVRLLGELCISIDRSRVAAEFALAVRPALHGHGLGRLLIHCLLDLCLIRRVTLACASVPAGSPAMLALAHGCGFQVLRAADGSAQLALMLRPRGVR